VFEESLARLKAEGLYRTLWRVDSPQGPRIRIGGRDLICLASNDYLGLAGHPALKAAASRAVTEWGTGSGASRLLSGSSRLHAELEEEIADFLGCEAALLFNSGYAANTGVLSALAQRGDRIFSDALNHASIIDGCRLSQSEITVYKHSDVNDLENKLKVNTCGGVRWIVTESVFSMDGDVAPLPGIVELAGRYDAHLYLDEAHAMGWMGRKGRGAASHFGLEDRITLRMGTLGKAFGSFGAYVAGGREMIEMLINRARPLIYSTALPPCVPAASSAALALIRGEEGERLRASLDRNLSVLAEGLESMGFLRVSRETPVFPVILGSVKKAVQVAEDLLEQGIFAPAIRPPTVPEGTSRLRFSVMATHTPEEMERVVSGLRKALNRAEGDR